MRGRQQPADEPYNSPNGRFNNGIRFTLYVADDATGATAEFYRRYPEFLAAPDIPAVQIYALDLSISGRCLDVRSRASAAVVGVPFDRLRSSDPDEATRYSECRMIADQVDALGCGVAYPSAASTATDAWCLVLLGMPTLTTWTCTAYVEVPMPILSDADVHVLTA